MFNNTIKLTAFTLRRERITSTAWIIGMAIVNFFVLMLIGLGMGAEAEDRAALMEMFSNPALLAFTGPLHPILGAAYSEIGYLYTLFMLVYLGIGAAVMNILLVVRHTRADEEAGRYEVLRSLPSGRLAGINSVMISAVIINVIMGLIVAVTMYIGMAICSEPGNSFTSALIWGASLTMIGLFFAAIAALFSQLSHSSSGASAYSYVALGVFYMLSAGANMGSVSAVTGGTNSNEPLAWLSPFGIASRTWPYIPDSWGGQVIENNLWWPLLIILALAAVITLVAYYLCSIRDIEQGLMPARKGKAEGGMLMKSTGGLSFRLLRRGVIVWVIIMFALGASYGSVFEDMDNYIASNDTYRQLALGIAPDIMAEIDAMGEDAPVEEIAAVMLSALEARGFNLAQMFSGMVIAISGLFSSIPVLMYILRVRKEEQAGRSELVISTPVTKANYMLGYVIITFVTAVFLQFLMGLGLYIVGQTMESVASYLTFEFMMQSSLAYVPALWVMGAVTLLLLCAFPRRAGWAWGYYGFTFFAVMFGRMDPSTEFLTRLTPMGYVPSLPVDEWNWASFIVLTLIAAALTVVSVVLYGKRDLNVVRQ